MLLNVKRGQGNAHMFWLNFPPWKLEERTKLFFSDSGNANPKLHMYDSLQSEDISLEFKHGESRTTVGREKKIIARNCTSV